MTDKPLILAIESAVAGGSISLLRGDYEITSWTGEGGVSRAEDLLPNIASLLERSRTDKQKLERLAVSTGPGSYTGIRIGIATALGLKNALGIPCNGLLVTEAMRVASSGEDFVTAIPMGRNDVCRHGLASEKPVLTTFSEFLEFIRSNPKTQIIAERSLYLRLTESTIPVELLVDAGSNLAHYVGLAASKIEDGEDLEPLFIKTA
jgi:tRNA threonylcarbamoyl adenosine modification protein YeaZ